MTKGCCHRERSKASLVAGGGWLAMGRTGSGWVLELPCYNGVQGHLDQKERVMSDNFVESLMDHIMAGTMIPKVQIERAVGPILSMFLPQVLTETLRDDPNLSGEIKMVCPEFPLKKAYNQQSTNIDWLMIDLTRKLLLFVELKTSDTSINSDQNAIYREVQRRVSEQGGGFLVSELELLRDASTESGKYQFILDEYIAPYRAQIAACREARLIYLVPKTAQHQVVGHADKVLSFGELADAISGPFAAEWKVIHNRLIVLDAVSQRTRNRQIGRDPQPQAGTNYQDKVTFDVIVDLCKQHGDAIVVGFSGGRKALENRPLSELTGRQYKWDQVRGGKGNKDPRNWIPGGTFAWVIERKAARSSAIKPAPIKKSAARSVNWAGTAKFDEMVGLCQQHGDNILIGFTGGRTAFANTPLDKLQNRMYYRWDYASSTAKRKVADWLRGGTVLELLREYHRYEG